MSLWKAVLCHSLLRSRWQGCLFTFIKLGSAIFTSLCYNTCIDTHVILDHKVGKQCQEPLPFYGRGLCQQACLTSLSANYVGWVMIPCDAYSSCKLYRFRLKVLMGRNGAGGTTSSSNIGEEYRTPKGGRRDVRLHVKLSRSPLNAMPTTESTIAAQERQSQSGENGPIHAATALWEFGLQTRDFAWHRRRVTTYRCLGDHPTASALWGRSSTANWHKAVIGNTTSVSPCAKKPKDTVQKSKIPE